MEIIERLKSETPEFFKKVITFGVSLLGIGLGVMLAPNGIKEHLPEWADKISSHLIAVGFIASLVAKAAKADK